MAAGLPDPSDYVRTQVKIVLAGIEFQTQAPVPRVPVKTRVMLPVIRAFTGAILNASERMARGRGESISCRTGCGACCRQLVPIAHSEAFELRDLVDDLPEARRAEIRDRFAAAAARLRQAGLADALTDPGRHSEQEMERIADEYFRLGIACPFLENESCSIHPDRPIVCREYLVSSPPECCANRDGEGVVRVPLAAKPSTALMQLDDVPDRKFLQWIPLILLLEWTDQHAEGEARPGTDLFGRFLQRLGKPPEYTSPPAGR